MFQHKTREIAEMSVSRLLSFHPIYIFGWVILAILIWMYTIRILIFLLTGGQPGEGAINAGLVSLLLFILIPGAILYIKGWLIPSDIKEDQQNAYLSVRACRTKTDAESVLVCLSKKLESFLGTHFNASGAGLHEKLDDIESKLNSGLVRNMRKIATIRNKAVHDARFEATSAEIHDFKDIAERAQKELCDITGIKLRAHKVLLTPFQWILFGLGFVGLLILSPFIVPFIISLFIGFFALKVMASLMFGRR